MEYVKSNKGGFKLLYDNYYGKMVQFVGNVYANPNGFFENHQPTRSYTGNHCTISKLCTRETMKFLKNETQKFYSGGFCPGVFVLGVFCPGGFVGGFMYGGFCPGGVCPRTDIVNHSVIDSTAGCSSLLTENGLHSLHVSWMTSICEVAAIKQYR